MNLGGESLFKEVSRLVSRSRKDEDIAGLIRKLFEVYAASTDASVYQELLRNLLLRTVAQEQKMSRLNEALSERQEQLDRDLIAAAMIQQNLLPKKNIAIPGYDFAWKFKPCDRVGGDVLFVIPIGNQGVMVAVLDVAGHGVPAAMVTVSVNQYLQPAMEHSMIRESTGECRPRRPQLILRELEREFPISRYGRFFTIIYGVIDTENHILQLANGGHPYPVLTSPGKPAEALGESGPLIGMLEGSTFPEYQRNLEAGDRLWLFSDCLEETPAPDGSRFQRERLEKLLSSLADVPLQEAVETVYREITGFAAGRPLEDDFTLLVVEKKLPGN